MAARRLFLVGLVVLLVVGGMFLAYGLTQPMSARTALADALRASGDVQSVHVVVDMEGNAPVPYAIHEEGDIEFPDRMHMVMEAGGERFEYILIGEAVYLRDPATGHWRREPAPFPPMMFQSWQTQALPSFQFDPRRFKEQTAGWGKVERLPDEVVDGVPCRHYRATFDMEGMMENLTDQPQGEDTPLAVAQKYARQMRMEGEYWVGQVDGRLRQMRVHVIMPGEMVKRMASLSAPAGRIPDIAFPPQVEIRMKVRYSDYNKPVHIEPPSPLSGR